MPIHNHYDKLTPEARQVVDRAFTAARVALSSRFNVGHNNTDDAEKRLVEALATYLVESDNRALLAVHA